MNKVVAKVGDCFASIAKQHGFESAAFLYEYEANAALRKARPNMHILQIGDPVFLPNKSNKTVPIKSDGCLSLTLKGQTTLFETIIEDFDGIALANKPYELEVAGSIKKGISDPQGQIAERINASAKSGTLRIFLDSVKKNVLTWQLEFGSLYPPQHPIGMQARLNNLGYYCANETGDIEITTQDAIKAFKSRHGLNPTATVDSTFIQKLVDEYGF